MSFFGAIVGTVVETVKLPVAVVRDTLTMGGTLSLGQNPDFRLKDTYTAEQLERIKNEADK